MSEYHCEVLQANLVKLIDSGRPTGLLDFLFSLDTLPRVEYDDIRGKDGDRVKMRELIMCLMCKPKKDYKNFCEALRVTKQKHLLKLLEDYQKTKVVFV